MNRVKLLVTVELDLLRDVSVDAITDSLGEAIEEVISGYGDVDQDTSGYRIEVQR